MPVCRVSESENFMINHLQSVAVLLSLASLDFCAAATVYLLVEIRSALRSAEQKEEKP